jgi:hypothetical protein
VEPDTTCDALGVPEAVVSVCAVFYASSALDAHSPTILTPLHAV